METVNKCQLMIFINAVYKEEVFPLNFAEGFIKLLNPIAPHITEELWSMLGHDKTIAYEPWPNYDESKMIDQEFTMVVQVNGKVRGKIVVNSNTTEEEMKDLALTIDNVRKFINDKEIVKVIAIPKKIVNIVVK